MMFNPDEIPEDGSEGKEGEQPEEQREEHYPRSEDVTYLLTLANRYDADSDETTSGKKTRGRPDGFLIIIQEEDGGFTHHLANPGDDMDWMALIGNMEVMKAMIINSKLAWEPVNRDGSPMTDEEKEAFLKDLDDDEEDQK